MVGLINPALFAEVMGAAPSSLSTTDYRAIRPGDGRCSADNPPRRVLRCLGRLRVGERFVTVLSRARGVVLGRIHRDAVMVTLTYGARGTVTKRVHHGVLVELP